MTDLDRLLELESGNFKNCDENINNEYTRLYEKLSDMEYKIKGLEAEVDFLEKYNKSLKDANIFLGEIVTRLKDKITHLEEEQNSNFILGRVGLIVILKEVLGEK